MNFLNKNTLNSYGKIAIFSYTLFMKSTLVPYLNFNGNCAEAMKFYHSILGGDLDLQTYEDTPEMPSSPENKDKVVHATLKNGSIVFMASDGNPLSEVKFGDSVNLSLNGPDNEELTEYFNKLAEGGKILMPLEKQFWGDKFGMLTDKFGINWMVNIGATL